MKRRELYWLLLPSLLLLGMGYWSQTRKPVATWTEDPTGPFRAAIKAVEFIPLTGLERWQGYDYKVRIWPEKHGKYVRNQYKDEDLFIFTTNAKLIYQLGAQTKSVAISGTDYFKFEQKSPRRVRNVPYWKPSTPKTVDMLLDTSDLPAGIRNLRVKGQLTAMLWGQRSTPAAVDIALPPTPPTDTSSLQATRVELDDTRFERMLPVQSLRVPTNDTRLTVQLLSIQPTTKFLRISDVRVVDQLGREVKPWAGTHQPILSQIEGDENRYFVDLAFTLLDIPLSRGVLKAEFWVAEGDSWPEKISTVIRPTEFSNLPKDLQLMGIQQVGERVHVKLRHQGKRGLRWDRGPVGKNTSQLYLGDHQHPAGHRLIANWSQRLELEGSKSMRYAAYLEKISANAKETEFTIVYKPDWPVQVQAGHKLIFKAEIGIEGVGFLPVSLPLKVPQA